MCFGASQTSTFSVVGGVLHSPAAEGWSVTHIPAGRANKLLRSDAFHSTLLYNIKLEQFASQKEWFSAT